jgi:Calcium/calmodulin dependent protein kinase II Association.
MKKNLFLFVLLLVMLGNCKQSGQNNQSKVLTPEEEQAIIQEVKNVLRKVEVGITSLNADSVFIYMNQKKFARFIDNGKVLNSYDSTYKTFKKIYGDLKKLNIVFSNDDYRVLSPNVVLVTFVYTEDVTTSNDVTYSFKGAATNIFQKIDGKWYYIHVHQSSFPNNKKK